MQYETYRGMPHVYEYIYVSNEKRELQATELAYKNKFSLNTYKTFEYVSLFYDILP